VIGDGSDRRQFARPERRWADAAVHQVQSPRIGGEIKQRGGTHGGRGCAPSGVQGQSMFLQYFDTVGWVFWPVKTVVRITYILCWLVETLNHAQSINQGQSPW